MRKNIFRKIGILAISATLAFGCTDKFEDFNIDKSKVTDEQLKADYYFLGGYFPQMQQMIYCNFNWGWGINWPFQIMQNLSADIFSGYMMTPTPFASNVNNTNYALVDGWNGSNWDYTYGYFMTASGEVERLAAEEYPQINAASKILRVTAMHRISDMYGPIIYTGYGDSQTGGDFDSQEEAYYAFFEDLDYAVEELDKYITENPGVMPLERYDLMFGGDFTQWIKFANSLRLRLAIRISNIDPNKAKLEGEKALQNPYGVLEAMDATVSGKGYNHPLFALSVQWGDIKMGGAIESIMTGYEDPRLEKYFLPVTDAELQEQNIKYKGIRQGIDLVDKAVYVDHSSLNFTSGTPAQLMTAAEVYFLRAEGALRSWANMGGTAADLYQKGVEASFTQYGLGVGDYLMSDNKAAAFTDIKNTTGVNNIAADAPELNNVSPKWEDAADFEIKLQKIITQKYIAMFPEGMEAWAEYRRTGYPILMPVVINNSQGKIDTDKQVRRLNFSVTEKSINPDGYAEAVQLLGGEDTGGTPLWWDVRP
ncbi:RagB/SusD family nutrient uptake outer membrane protein [Saccharicrinis aurantiacus]|uniref:RagB/SusD family nutrient uptake outer membrane protein n=1 Tax=Saccharicrinis aurantiacus TaxID=1849719 RepID=UPI002492961F|nr:RagB/SusD family nutrient uptake outer membrane protein [Saccharicrinis aurantiacus]